MTEFSVADLISYYQLLPHPEGGYYKETYRCSEQVPQHALPGRFNGDRNFSTAIYFLLEQGNFSAFHKISSDECWHFYAGGPLNVFVISTDGEVSVIKLGNNISAGETFQAVVPAGCWFASAPADNTAYALVGCTVAPGFDFADFELAERNSLISQYPQHEAIINQLTRG